MRIINKIAISLFLIFPLKSQEIELSGEIFEYATYYVSSFDLSTGATNVPIFRYTLESNEGYPVSLRIRFTAEIKSPVLGINENTPIVEITTAPFDLYSSIILDNRDISTGTTSINYINPPSTGPSTLEITGESFESLDPNEAEAIMQSVVTTGKIPDGEYTFRLEILHESDDEILVEAYRAILVQAPVSISLESPAGELSDTLESVIFSTYPIFQWFSQACSGCNSFIRVSQFNAQVHSSMEDAMEDQRVLPFDQSEEWYSIDNLNSFQYPFSGAYPLEEGNVYCWQIMMTMPTTAGTEEMYSEIAAFKIGEAGEVETSDMITNPLLVALQQAIGDEQFNALFGSGSELQGYNPTGQVEINGITVDESGVNYLLNQIISATYQVQSIEIE